MFVLGIYPQLILGVINSTVVQMVEQLHILTHARLDHLHFISRRVLVLMLLPKGNARAARAIALAVGAGGSGCRPCRATSQFTPGEIVTVIADARGFLRWASIITWRRTASA